MIQLVWILCVAIGGGGAQKESKHNAAKSENSKYCPLGRGVNIHICWPAKIGAKRAQWENLIVGDRREGARPRIGNVKEYVTLALKKSAHARYRTPATHA